MQYKYFSVYRIGGMSLPNNQSEIVLINDNLKGRKVLLTSDIDSHSLIFDRHEVYRNNLVGSLFGGGELIPSPEIMKEKINEIQKNRNKNAKSLYLLFEFAGEIDCELPEIVVEREDYFLLEPINNNEIKTKYSAEINKFLASIFLVSNQDFKINKVSNGIYLIHESGKIIYSFGLSGDMKLSSVAPLNKSSLDKFSKYVSSNSSKNFITINRLIVSANIEHKDNFRAFLFIWTALEIFIEYANDQYKPTFNTGNFLKKNKNGELAIKFYAISSFLTKNNHQNDYAEFIEIKKLRNSFIHYNKGSEDKLPTDKLKSLLKKYLALYLENNP